MKIIHMKKNRLKNKGTWEGWELLKGTILEAQEENVPT